MSEQKSHIAESMTHIEQLQADVDFAETLLAGFDPSAAFNHSDAYKAWHAINNWRSMTQWMLDRHNGHKSLRDSKWRAAP